MKQIIQNFPVVLLISAIALSPSFSAGTFAGGKIIELRIEDFLIVILGLIWIANFLISRKEKIEKPPLLFPILIWLSIAFISVLTNLIFSNLLLDRSFFYFFKYVEIFIFYFYIFYHIKSIDSAKFLIKLWIFLGALNVIFVVYQIMFRASGAQGFLATIYDGFITKIGLRAGEYGAGAIGEWGVFPSGAFFLIIFVFLLNIFLYYFLNQNISIFKKGMLGILMISPALGVFGSASKTNFLALIFTFFLTIFFLFLKKKNFRLIFGTILIFIFLTTLFVFSLQAPVVERLIPNLSLEYTIGNYKAGRLDFILPPLKESLEHPFLPFLGFGVGYVTEAHNQYVRNFIETGIIGSFAFIFLIWVILRKSFQVYSKSQDSFSVGLAAGLLVATFSMLFFSLATDPFIVVKPASVFWSFAALAMAVFTLQKSNHGTST